MRTSTCFAAWLSVLAGSAQLVAGNIAYVLTFDPQAAKVKHQIAIAAQSPEMARLVLAQRLGVEDYHMTSSPGDAEINAINKYGAKTNILQTGNSKARALLLAELPEQHESHTMLRLHATLTIANPPDFEASQELIQDLYTQSHPSRVISRDTLRSDVSAREDWPIFHVAEDANALIVAARELAAKQIEVTALLVPAGRRNIGWGTYGMPSNKAKRQSPHRLEPEEPLEEFTHPVMALASNASNSTSNHTGPLRGILPACFPSRRACDSETRSCTGHGQCTLKYTNKDHSEKSKTGECWGCQCAPTKAKGLTTKWGGPACQKKDISAEFWLIALFTIGLVGLVSFAIGNLLSMGEQELPSVIGAGVSGPTARK